MTPVILELNIEISNFISECIFENCSKVYAKILCNALLELVPFVPFKKHEKKRPWTSDNFSTVPGLQACLKFVELFIKIIPPYIKIIFEQNFWKNFFF